MIANSKALLKAARAAGRYVPAFNIYNLETVRAALDASVCARQPVILAFGESYLAHAPFEAIFALVQSLAQGHPHDTVLHLDHCRDLNLIRAALDAGFPSVMYDGSLLPLTENIRNTLEARKLTDRTGASLEGELGSLNEEGGLRSDGMVYTDPLQAACYARETGIDSLAISVGNAHGLYKGIPCLNMERLMQIEENTGLPLVLHGSTGIDAEQLAQAAALGISKINVNTDIAMAASQAAREALAGADGNRYEHVALAVRGRMREVMESYFMREAQV
jgi:ketose-bisphosphate aldolase